MNRQLTLGVVAVALLMMAGGQANATSWRPTFDNSALRAALTVQASSEPKVTATYDTGSFEGGLATFLDNGSLSLLIAGMPQTPACTSPAMGFAECVGNTIEFQTGPLSALPPADCVGFTTCSGFTSGKLEVPTAKASELASVLRCRLRVCVGLDTKLLSGRVGTNGSSDNGSFSVMAALTSIVFPGAGPSLPDVVFRSGSLSGSWTVSGGDVSGGHLKATISTATPEPGTLGLVLLGTGLIGLEGLRRRKLNHGT